MTMVVFTLPGGEIGRLQNVNSMSDHISNFMNEKEIKTNQLYNSYMIVPFSKKQQENMHHQQFSSPFNGIKMEQLTVVVIPVDHQKQAPLHCQQSSWTVFYSLYYTRIRLQPTRIE